MENEPKKANAYIPIIKECRAEIDCIYEKLDIIISPSISEKGSDIPSRTELESELTMLLNKIKNLKRDIVM